jgi:hypothetical protein
MRVWQLPVAAVGVVRALHLRRSRSILPPLAGDILPMLTNLLPLFPRLEAAAVHGPGKHELVRNFAAYQASNPDDRIFALTDSYGRVWIRQKDVERVVALLLPHVITEELVSTRVDTNRRRTTHTDNVG